MIISAEINQESEDKDEIFSRKEYAFSSFKRTFDLPETVNSEAIQASYENGVLRVNMPKKDEAHIKPRNISIG